LNFAQTGFQAQPLTADMFDPVRPMVQKHYFQARAGHHPGQETAHGPWPDYPDFHFFFLG
jgi:hypothetical protein